MSNQKPSEDSSRRNFLSAAAVVASAAVAAPTVAKAQTGPTKKPRGIYADQEEAELGQIKIADFSYTNDALAQLIVDMWLGNHPTLSAEGERTERRQRSTKRVRPPQKQPSRSGASFWRSPS